MQLTNNPIKKMGAYRTTRMNLKMMARAAQAAKV